MTRKKKEKREREKERRKELKWYPRHQGIQSPNGQRTAVKQRTQKTRLNTIHIYQLMVWYPSLPLPGQGIQGHKRGGNALYLFLFLFIILVYSSLVLFVICSLFSDLLCVHPYPSIHAGTRMSFQPSTHTQVPSSIHTHHLIIGIPNTKAIDMPSIAIVHISLFLFLKGFIGQ